MDVEASMRSDVYWREYGWEVMKKEEKKGSGGGFI